MATNSTTRKTIIIDIKGKEAKIQVDGVQKSFKELNHELNRMQTGAQGASAATGAASATVLELGRAVSDSNYGIRGMANNLSQLATNFIYTTKQAGTLLGGLKNIGQALMGPLGVILLFQGAIAMLERFSMQSGKTKEEVKGLNDALGGAGSNLRILRDTLKKGVLTQEEANEAVRKANEEYGDLNLSLDENNELTKESKIAIDNKIESLKHLAKALALQSLLEEKYSELLSLESKQVELDTDAKIKNAAAINAINTSLKGTGTAVAESAAARARGAQEAGQEAIDALKKEIEELLQLAGDEGLVSELFKEPKGARGGRTKTSKDKPPVFGDPIFDVDALMEGYDETKQMEFDLRRRYLDSRALFYDEARIQASESNNRILEDEIAHREKMLIQTEIGSLERIEAENEIAMMRMDLQDQEFEHEMLLLDLKMQAQMEYVGFVTGIGDVLAGLGKRSEELATLSLVVQKGAAIAEVVISASQSIAARMAAHALIPPFITMPMGISIPNPVKAIDAAAMGKDITMTKVGAGISIAAILATAIKGGKRSITSGGGRAGGAEGTGGGRTFDFNLVGTTGTNQLAEAVGAQFQEPIQAFVVSSQITSQQELDLEISTGASLGD